MNSVQTTVGALMIYSLSSEYQFCVPTANFLLQIGNSDNNDVY